MKICICVMKGDHMKATGQRNALGLEGLIWFKSLYYPKESTDLMQSLSKYPGCFSQN